MDVRGALMAANGPPTAAKLAVEPDHPNRSKVRDVVFSNPSGLSRFGGGSLTL